MATVTANGNGGTGDGNPDAESPEEHRGASGLSALGQVVEFGWETGELGRMGENLLLLCVLYAYGRIANLLVGVFTVIIES
jgi:hypothetical protein